MAKKLAGKKWFHAMGQSDSARKTPMTHLCRSQRPDCWPDWAKDAYIRGYHGLGP